MGTRATLALVFVVMLAITVVAIVVLTSQQGGGYGLVGGR